MRIAWLAPSQPGTTISVGVRRGQRAARLLKLMSNHRFQGPKLRYVTYDLDFHFKTDLSVYLCTTSLHDLKEYLFSLHYLFYTMFLYFIVTKREFA